MVIELLVRVVLPRCSSHSHGMSDPVRLRGGGRLLLTHGAEATATQTHTHSLGGYSFLLTWNPESQIHHPAPNEDV